MAIPMKRATYTASAAPACMHLDSEKYLWLPNARPASGLEDNPLLDAFKQRNRDFGTQPPRESSVDLAGATALTNLCALMVVDSIDSTSTLKSSTPRLFLRAPNFRRGPRVASAANPFLVSGVHA